VRGVGFLEVKVNSPGWRTIVSDTSKNEEERGNSRWWEHYSVRYFIGTVVGALILLTLEQYAQLAPEFQRLIPIKEINGWGLSAVAAAGLAYCYIASAPILTLHAMRGGLDLATRDDRVLLGAFVGALVGLPLMAWGAAWALQRTSALGWILTAECFVGQIFLIVMAQRYRFKKITSFYDRLVNARCADRIAGKDYTDSYRHLREHGNAKMIIILEIFLGAIMASADDGAELVMMLVLWLVPAAYVWFIGSILEAHFAKTRA
jgi:hypothetical protein